LVADVALILQTLYNVVSSTTALSFVVLHHNRFPFTTHDCSRFLAMVFRSFCLNFEKVTFLLLPWLCVFRIHARDHPRIDGWLFISKFCLFTLDQNLEILIAVVLYGL